MGVMQDNERNQDIKYADDLTPAEQEVADKLPDSGWDTLFSVAAITLVAVSLGTLPLADYIRNEAPFFVRFVVAGVVGIAFVLVTISAVKGQQVRKSRVLAEHRAAGDQR